jgi:hypothetical protein
LGERAAPPSKNKFYFLINFSLGGFGGARSSTKFLSKNVIIWIIITCKNCKYNFFDCFVFKFRKYFIKNFCNMFRWIMKYSTTKCLKKSVKTIILFIKAKYTKRNYKCRRLYRQKQPANIITSQILHLDGGREQVKSSVLKQKAVIIATILTQLKKPNTNIIIKSYIAGCHQKNRKAILKIKLNISKNYTQNIQ